MDAVLQKLLDDHEITRLCYRYGAALDDRDWGRLRTCFTDDAVTEYEGLGQFEGYPAIEEVCRTALGPLDRSQHLIGNVLAEVDGDTATGRWYLYDRVIVEAFSFMLEGAAFYSDRYVRTPDGWRVAHTGYRRTFEATYNLGDLPGFKLNGPGVHTHR